MIKINSLQTDIDVELYTKRIGRKGYVLYDRDLLEKASKDIQTKSIVYQMMAIDKMMHKSRCAIGSVSKEAVIRYLKNFEFCPDRFFKNSKVKSESINMKRCLVPLKENGYAQEFLDYYMKYSSYKSKYNSIKKLRDVCNEHEFNTDGTNVVNHYGKELYKIPCTPRVQINLRFNYSNFDIIAQLPKKEVSHCISIEDDYVLAWGDFAQSDFRIAYNLFMRSPENDAIMSKYEDKYEGLSRIINAKAGRPFNQKEFEKERPLFKTLTLATVYGKRESMIEKEADFIRKFASFLEKCPRYVEYCKQIEATTALQPAVWAYQSYFGFEETVPVNYDIMDKKDLQYFALNSPVQTGTSEIVIYVTNKLLADFYERGWTENDVSLYYVRHDEIIFKIRKEALQDAWILKQVEQIFVDDWTPLSCSFELGYNYNRPDAELMEQYEKIAQKNKNKINIFKPDTKLSRMDYSPLLPVIELQICYSYLESEKKTLLTFYQLGSKSVDWALVSSMRDVDIKDWIQRYCSTLQFDYEIRGVIVYNTFLDELIFDRHNSILFRFTKTFSEKMSENFALCKWITCLYCKKLGITSPVEPPVRSFEPFIKSVEIRGIDLSEAQEINQESSFDGEDEESLFENVVKCFSSEGVDAGEL